MLYSKMDVKELADVFENFIEQPTLMFGNYQLYSYSAPGYTWNAGLKLTYMKLSFIKGTATLASGTKILLL